MSVAPITSAASAATAPARFDAAAIRNADPATQRAAYVRYLVRRVAQRDAFVQEAIRARA